MSRNKKFYWLSRIHSFYGKYCFVFAQLCAWIVFHSLKRVGLCHYRPSTDHRIDSSGSICAKWRPNKLRVCWDVGIGHTRIRMIKINPWNCIITGSLCRALIYFLCFWLPRRLLSRGTWRRLPFRVTQKNNFFFIKKMAYEVYERNVIFSAETLNFPLSYSSALAKLSFAARDIKRFYWILGFYVPFAYKKVHMLLSMAFMYSRNYIWALVAGNWARGSRSREENSISGNSRFVTHPADQLQQNYFCNSTKL